MIDAPAEKGPPRVVESHLVFNDRTVVKYQDAELVPT